jgi:F-type H+-transporting ATPase subunit b
MDLLTPDGGLFIWQLLGFLALLFLLAKFAWGPILSALDERENSINSALQAAEEAKAEIANLKAANEELLEKARVERDQILATAREAARRFEQEQMDVAKAKADKMLEDTRLAIENEKNAAITEVKNQVAQLSLDIAEKLLRRKLEDVESQKALVGQFLNEQSLN